MAARLNGRANSKREFPVDTIVHGLHVSSGILLGLNDKLKISDVERVATSLRRLRRQGKGIILRCRETFPYMIRVLSEVDGIIEPKSRARVKGHSAEFCREEGKTLVVADESTWVELERYEGDSVLVDSRGKKIILDPDRQTARLASNGYVPHLESKAIGDLIKAGRHISLLSTVPEHIGFTGHFSFFCRQEQLVMSKGTSPWELLTRSREECEQILATVWSEYASVVQPGIEIVFRSHDARSDEYPGSPIGREPNPQLGNHGPALFESFPHLLEAEVAAIARVKGEDSEKKITYLLPFVRSAKEIRLARSALDHALEKDSLPETAVELAVMYETPSLPYLIDEITAANVRTIWIGTKDLLMSFLMVDRDNSNRQLQDYLRIHNDRGEENLAFIEYLTENINKFIDRGFEVVMYSLASEVPIFTKYLPSQVGFLLSKGSVKAALRQFGD